MKIYLSEERETTLYSIKDSTLISFADEIRRITGKTNYMSPTTMLNELKAIPAQTS